MTIKIKLTIRNSKLDLNFMQQRALVGNFVYPAFRGNLGRIFSWWNWNECFSVSPSECERDAATQRCIIIDGAGSNECKTGNQVGDVSVLLPLIFWLFFLYTEMKIIFDVPFVCVSLFSSGWILIRKRLEGLQMVTARFFKSFD